MEELKQFRESINSYEIQQVDMNSILGIKKLADNINNFEKQYLWKDFETKFNSIIIKFIELDIFVDPNIKDIREYPKNIVIIMKDTIAEMQKIEKNQQKLEELKNLQTVLIKEHIEQEDKQEDLETKIEYLYELMDEKFEWLDDNENFIQLSELLEKISNEICEGILRFVDQKKQFYTEYLKGYDTLYIKKYIKSYLLHNFNNVFNQACLDVLDQNNIKDENQIKTIISLYYDHIKSNIKLLLLN